MIEFRPFKAGHLKFLKPQAAQRKDHSSLVHSGGAAMLEGHIALSAWDGVVCIGVAGLIPVWPHRAVAWLILSDRSSECMLPLARKVRRVLKAAPYRRVELTVAEGFDAGHRFARVIGAVRETPEPMRFYGAGGGNEYMYAVIKEEQTCQD